MSDQKMLYFAISIVLFGINLCALGSDRDARRPMPAGNDSDNMVQFKPGGPIDLRYTLQALSDGTMEVIITASSPRNFSLPELLLKGVDVISKANVELNVKTRSADRRVVRNRYQINPGGRPQLVVKARVTAQGVNQSRTFYIPLQGHSQADHPNKNGNQLDQLAPAASAQPAVRAVSILPAKTTISRAKH